MLDKIESRLKAEAMCRVSSAVSKAICELDSLYDLMDTPDRVIDLTIDGSKQVYTYGEFRKQFASQLKSKILPHYENEVLSEAVDRLLHPTPTGQLRSTE